MKWESMGRASWGVGKRIVSEDGGDLTSISVTFCDLFRVVVGAGVPVLLE
jgi:hypothetical protein